MHGERVNGGKGAPNSNTCVKSTISLHALLFDWSREQSLSYPIRSDPAGYCLVRNDLT